VGVRSWRKDLQASDGFVGRGGSASVARSYELIGLGEHDDLGNSDSHRFAVRHGNHHVHFEPLIERSFDAKPALGAGFPQ
jgi:hypothetical protein